MDRGSRFPLMPDSAELVGSAVLRGLLSGSLAGFLLFIFLPRANPLLSGVWQDYRLLPLILSFLWFVFFLMLVVVFGFMAGLFHRRPAWMNALPRAAGWLSGVVSYIYFLQIWRWCWLEQSGTDRSAGMIGLGFLCLMVVSAVAGWLGSGLVNKIRLRYLPQGHRDAPIATGKAGYILFILALACFISYVLYIRHNFFSPSPVPEQVIPLIRTPPLLVIAMDGIESDMVRTLIGGGQLPAFHRFLEDGRFYLTYPVTPRDPLLVWNAIASGYNLLWNDVFYLNGDYYPRRSFHTWPGGKALGIAFPPLKFDALRTLLEVTKAQKGFWEIGAEKKKALVVNWRGSWAAGPLPGTIISDMTYPGLLKDKKIKGFASPVEVEDELRRRFDTDWRAGDASLSIYLPDLFRWELRKFINRTAAVDDYYARICLRYMDREDYECIILYLHGLEALKYIFFADGHKLSVSDLYARVEVLKSYYIFLDTWLHTLTTCFDPEGHVLLIGDPGRIAIQGDYLASGLLGCRGPGIRPGGIAGYINELAATPMIVTLMGIPPTDQMEEELPEDLFRRPFPDQRSDPAEVPSYGPRYWKTKISRGDLEAYLRQELAIPAYALWE